jgi:hypothetical protein
MPDFSYFLHVLTPFNPPLYDVERGKPERSGGEGEYMKRPWGLVIKFLRLPAQKHDDENFNTLIN